MIFVDTNFFLRFILNDIPQQHKLASDLFKDSAQGKIKLFTNHLVLFEIHWVLKSGYEQKKDETTKLLLNLLKLNFIELEGKEFLIDVLRFYKKKNLDLEDCYHLLYAKAFKAESMATFDDQLFKEFKRKRK